MSFLFYGNIDSKGKRYRANFRWTFATAEDRARSSRENRVLDGPPSKEDIPFGMSFLLSATSCGLEPSFVATPQSLVRIPAAERVELDRKRQGEEY